MRLAVTHLTVLDVVQCMPKGWEEEKIVIERVHNIRQRRLRPCHHLLTRGGREPTTRSTL